MVTSLIQSLQKRASSLAMPYFLLTLVFSFTGFSLFAASETGNLPFVIPFEIAWLAQFGPSFIAICLIGFKNDISSFKTVMNRFLNWHIDLKFYGMAILTAPLLATMVLTFNQLIGLVNIEWADLGSLPEAMGSYLDNNIVGPMGPLQSVVNFALESSAWVTITVVLIFAILAGGVSEELGWRGYLLSKLQASYKPITVSLIIALFWAIWHISPQIWKILFESGILAFLSNAVMAVGFYAINLIPLTVILIFIVNKSQASVIPAILFHAFFNLTSLTIEELWPNNSFFLQMMVLFWILAIIIVSFNRAHFFSLHSWNQDI